MKKFLSLSIFVLSMILFVACDDSKNDNYSSFSQYPVYSGSDLGVNVVDGKTIVKLWSPASNKVVFRIFEDGYKSQELQSFQLEKKENGVWEKIIDQDLRNKYYTFQVNFDGKWLEEEADPYAKAVGVNGKRGMIVDLNDTNPEGWNQDKSPLLKSFSDIIIYELHVRDYSISENSGITNKGKFLGLSEFGTKGPKGVSTGIDHIKEMGVSHVHILPAFDFRSIDETKLEENKYNWGYDPQNYNVPEGSYSTDPYNGLIRIKEFKEMVMALHKSGLRVVMDVVYNHTGYTKESNFDQLVPGYYYRQWEDGSYSNSSACGNETASDREMFRKFMIQSIMYWAKEYHIDGFRFDLMGIHDIETMNQISSALKEFDPSIFVYGEGWTAGDSPLVVEDRAIKANASKLDEIAVFSDDIRDGIKGSWNDEHSKGYVSGNLEKREDVKFGIVASTKHPQVDYSKVDYVKEAYSKSPLQTINYVSCHDNHTLFDKLKLSNPEASLDELKRLHKLSNSMVMLSQGVPFLHAGVEMLRTKQGVENSFESPDSINKIDWQWKADNMDHVEFYKNLIQLRKEHPAFKMQSVEDLQNNLTFVDFNDETLLGFKLNGEAVSDSWKEILVVFNVCKKDKEVLIEGKGWKVALDGDHFYLNKIQKVKAKKGKVKVNKQSTLVLYR